MQNSYKPWCTRYFFFSQNNLESIFNILLLVSSMFLLSLQTIPRTLEFCGHKSYQFPTGLGYGQLLFNKGPVALTGFLFFFFNFNFYYYFFAAKQQRLMDQLTHVRIKTKLRQREQTQQMLPGECLTKEQCSLNHVMHIVLKYMECVHV